MIGKQALWAAAAAMWMALPGLPAQDPAAEHQARVLDRLQRVMDLLDQEQLGPETRAELRHLVGSLQREIAAGIADRERARSHQREPRRKAAADIEREALHELMRRKGEGDRVLPRLQEYFLRQREGERAPDEGLHRALAELRHRHLQQQADKLRAALHRDAANAEEHVRLLHRMMQEAEENAGGDPRRAALRAWLESRRAEEKVREHEAEEPEEIEEAGEAEEVEEVEPVGERHEERPEAEELQRMLQEMRRELRELRSAVQKIRHRVQRQGSAR